jgi:hypothetical protein
VKLYEFVEIRFAVTDSVAQLDEGKVIAAYAGPGCESLARDAQVTGSFLTRKERTF